MKILFVSAGGGHFSPALTVIKRFKKEDVVVVGRKYALEGDSTIALEYKVCQDLGIRFLPLTTGRLQRHWSIHTIPSLLKIPLGFLQAVGILLVERPAVVVSFGGYVAVPVVYAAKLFRIPIVMHEQTLEAGLANKLSAKVADKICISWESSSASFPKEKVVLTGNPIKKELLALQPSAKKKKRPLIYITGGSVGSHAINMLIEEALPHLLFSYDVLHQTGDAKQYDDFDRLKSACSDIPEAMQERYTVKKFLTSEEVLTAYSQADLIISRSGIGTVTELLYLGKPCILIPLPTGQNNEQMKNALFLKSLGVAHVIEQHAADAQQLVTLCKTMLENKKTYEKAGSKARHLIKKDAAERIAAIIQACAQ